MTGYAFASDKVQYSLPLSSPILFPPPSQLVPKATHNKTLDQSFGSARVQCTAAGRGPEDCRDPRVLEGILGKYYPSKFGRELGKEGAIEGGRGEEVPLFAIMALHRGLRLFFQRVQSRPNCVYQRSNYLLFYPSPPFQPN